MSTLSKFRTVCIAATAALLLMTSACSNDDAPARTPAPESSIGPNDDAQDAPSPGELDGDYAFGTDRDQMATAIESAFKSKNGKATWESDTLVLSIDGDMDAVMAGFSECMVLDQLLNEEDKSVVEFPGGRVDCAEILPTD